MLKEKHKIAFIFIEEIHHLYHFISVADELSKKNQVHILTFPTQDVILEKTLAILNNSNIIVERKSTHFFRAITDKLKNRKHPRAGFWMKKNARYILNNFDAVVFSDYNHQKLLKIRGDKKYPKFIKFPHGIAGRKYAFKKEITDFDQQILFGEFYAQALQNQNLLKKHAIVGYPKLDVIKKLNTKIIFDNHKKTVIYNPHFSQPTSSWHKFGIDILEFFSQQSEFNLIFAPHINLFHKRGASDKEEIPEKYYNNPNIHIDLGSHHSVDMTYVKNADIYLGDVSSQVYEFIINPKPTIFINANQADYKNDIGYRFWKCGKVIDKIDDLPNALEQAFSTFGKFKETQKKINSENILASNTQTASEKAAEKIEELLAQ
ncbi:CDP-glycerol glycerophosphotransferase family protein [Mesonia sp. K7]|uniref:CDP-glycerol glycerophosphotransferase family protein n=1 Tax=Mesonia sp. K7 TaxID=2218606 RepID=UPI000DA9AC36|nr:CDP-glycerol glycerophosphotransferase family protein [Mesonia sp. K7]PZD78243.1 hypothetical protein DNG35_05965 [Mesonia sp. K7]